MAERSVGRSNCIIAADATHIGINIDIIVIRITIEVDAAGADIITGADRADA